MAGGVLKTFGVLFLILGILGILGGVVAAGYGFMMAQENQDQLIPDPDVEEQSEILLIGGGATAAVGLVLTILGAVFMSIGGASAHRETLRAITSTGAAAAPSPPPPIVASQPSRNRWVIPVAVVGILVLAGIGVAAMNGSGVATLGTAGFSGSRNDAAAPPIEEAFEGHVQGARAPLVGGLNPDASESVHVLAATISGGTVAATLDWTPGPAGANSLVVILEVGGGNTWQELARVEGGPGLELVHTGAWQEGDLRFRAFIGGSGAGDQDYTLATTLTAA